jgi:lipopolysaccharide transport system permease protein
MGAAPGLAPGSGGVWTHRDLVLELVRREFSGRYQGSFGGIAWSFAQPLFLLAVYTVAFGVVLQARWGFAGGTADYALMMFAGLIVFNAFAECLQKAPTLVAGNPNYVKKVVFPLEVLPWVMALTALFHALVGIAVWIAGFMLLHGVPAMGVLLFPVVLAAFFPVMLGVGWLLAALGVAVRDVAQVTGMLGHALLFLTPIFYSVEAVPREVGRILLANPLTFIVEQLRRVLYFGEAPSLPGLALYFLMGTLFAALALAFFRRMRPRFGDLV